MERSWWSQEWRKLCSSSQFPFQVNTKKGSWVLSSWFFTQDEYPLPEGSPATRSGGVELFHLRKLQSEGSFSSFPKNPHIYSRGELRLGWLPHVVISLCVNVLKCTCQFQKVNFILWYKLASCQYESKEQKH